ncbi:hypothetical protein ICL81_07395 [Leucobacter sp. cx-328]|uniref:exonuclease domain-containing protein n=1 Tax=unclassified Leucobacter TaxID=2621730 RepID=UPI00165D9A30|nr:MULTISPECIES: exonuclease domain-containing protein [unclassified Leucobacter]MBC9944333.1 hypothetical protein [Leucobacter sp. cx-328]
MNRGFAVLDFETTGLSPKFGHRILEVGVLLLDADFRIEGSFETLVNPGRDVGPTSIHGVTAADIRDAPAFDRVAPALMAALDGRLVVGHNVAFDLRFLSAELEREGYEVPEIVAIDTMKIAKQIFVKGQLPSFKLSDLAAYFELEIGEVLARSGFESRPAHSAFGDAAVTAYVLRHLYELASGSAFWGSQLDYASRVVWPEYVPVTLHTKLRGSEAGIIMPKQNIAVPEQARPTVTMPVATSRPAAESSIGDVFQAIGAAVPAAAGTASYAALLDTALEDGILDASEVDDLVRTAKELGLDGVTLGSLHRGHFDAAVRAAWADGVLTAQERADIISLSNVLCIDKDSLARALEGVHPEEASAPEPLVTHLQVPDAAAVAQAANAIGALAPGTVIVLTGTMTMERSTLEAEIAIRGFVVGKGVTKKTGLVIAADPHTLSGKAKKAHEYGIQVVGEHEGFALIRG